MIGIRDRNEPNGYKTNSTTQKVDATLSSTSNNPPSNKAVRSAMPFNFGIDEEGNYGYIPIGADSVVPFKGKIAMGSATTSIYDYVNVNLGFMPDFVILQNNHSLVQLINTFRDFKNNIATTQDRYSASTPTSADYQLTNLLPIENGFKYKIPDSNWSGDFYYYAFKL